MNLTAATDEAALLKAIIADPADDLPRLAYADLLEEAGEDDRAEFIRAQVGFARLQSEECACGFVPHPVCDVCRLGRRIAALWDAAVPPGGWIDVPGWAGEFRFRRGFLAEVRPTAADWLEHGPWAVRNWPLERVELIGKRPYAVPDADEALFGWRHDLAGIRADPPGPAPTLDKRLWSALAGGDVGSRTPNWKDYPSEAAAEDALSDACLAWARSAPPAL